MAAHINQYMGNVPSTFTLLYAIMLLSGNQQTLEPYYMMIIQQMRRTFWNYFETNDEDQNQVPSAFSLQVCIDFMFSFRPLSQRVSTSWLPTPDVL